MDRRSGHAQIRADRDWTQPLLPPQMHDLADWIRGVLFGLECGREERSCSACLAHLDVATRPPFRGPPRHPEVARGGGDRPLVVDDHFCASRSRWRGVKAALAWVAMRTSLVSSEGTRQLHSRPGGPHPSTEQSHLNQRPWAAQLARGLSLVARYEACAIAHCGPLRMLRGGPFRRGCVRTVGHAPCADERVARKHLLNGPVVWSHVLP